MLFNSVEFIVFFAVVFTAFRLLPVRARRPLLLLASYYFYMSWKPEYVVLILASTLIDYVAARQIEVRGSLQTRRSWLGASLVANLGILVTFKYWNFFGETVQATLRQANSAWQVPTLELLLPVGISFYTFQTLSYTIDVYRGQRSAERNLTNFALYVAFFPQLVAGPIERSARLLPQLKVLRNPTSQQVVAGLRLIVWGFFLKVVVADTVGPLVDGVYSEPLAFPGPSLALATVLFAYQIYCDFAGYSAIAIGSAKLLGIELMRNFDRPYSARSLREFWQRWHISLSTWFRDYLYIPLGGNRVPGPSRRILSIMIVFLVSGLWHGANWTFVAWGGVHGSWLVLGRLLSPARCRLVRRVGLERVPRIHAALQVASTFFFCCMAWVFFRAESVAQAFRILSQSAYGVGAWVWGVAFDVRDLRLAIEPWLMGSSVGIVWRSLALVLALEVIQFLLGTDLGSDGKGRVWRPVRWVIYVCVVCLILNVGSLREQPFIYFQF